LKKVGVGVNPIFMLHHLKNITAFVLLFFLLEFLISEIGLSPDYDQIWALWMGGSALFLVSILWFILGLPITIGTLSIYTASTVGVRLMQQNIIGPELTSWIIWHIIMVIISYFIYVVIFQYKVPMKF
jgi:hypothetical protein